MISMASELTSKLNHNLYGANDDIKGLSLMQKLNPANKNLSMGLTLVEGSSSFPIGLNTGLFSMISDASKIKRKIMLPKDSNVNYNSILVGSKGNAQKQLEEKTGCKIVVKGRGSQYPAEPYEEEEDLHVLILGDNETQVSKACAEIERIIFADDDTMNRMKQEQIGQMQPVNEGGQGGGQGGGPNDNKDYNLALTTPYGPPSENAYILEVPNECVGLVIGKEGETIKSIAKKSGALKVQVATSSAPNSRSRNIFVEGDPESVERVRRELNAIVETQRKMNTGSIGGSHKIEVEVPVRLIGLIIGKGGETIKGINARTGAYVCLNKDECSRRNRKIVTITGTEDLCLIARYEVEKIIQKGLINLQNTGGLTTDEAEMVKPIMPIAMQLAQANIPIPTQIQTIKEDPTTQYVLNHSLQSQVSTTAIYDHFLGPTSGIVEEVLVEETKPKKPRFASQNF